MKNADLGQRVRIGNRIAQVGAQSRAGHAIARFLDDAIDAQDFNRSLYWLLVSIRKATEEIAQARREEMHPDA